MIPPLRYVCMTSESQTCYNRSKVTYKLSIRKRAAHKGRSFLVYDCLRFAYALANSLLFLSILLYFKMHVEYRANIGGTMGELISLFRSIYTNFYRWYNEEVIRKDLFEV